MYAECVPLIVDCFLNVSITIKSGFFVRMLAISEVDGVCRGHLSWNTVMILSTERLPSSLNAVLINLINLFLPMLFTYASVEVATSSAA